MVERFTQREAEQEVTIYPNIKHSLKSMMIWRKGNILLIETYNVWGTISATIHMTKDDLCEALKILHQCDNSLE